jgi:hypothetical protein
MVERNIKGDVDENNLLVHSDGGQQITPQFISRYSFTPLWVELARSRFIIATSTFLLVGDGPCD